MTQPAVTQRIHALERELGVQLLLRTSRDVRLTADGDFLLPYATRLVQLSDEALRDLKSRGTTGSGRLRVAYVSHIDIAALAAVIEAFRRRRPSVQIETTLSYTRLNVEQVLRDEVDLAFVTGFGDIPSRISYRPVGLSELVVVLPTRHPLAGAPVVAAADLRGEPLILFPEHANPALASSLDGWLLRLTVSKPNVVLRQPYELAVESVGRSGRLLALVPKEVASRMTSPSVVYRALSPAPVFEIGVIHRRDDPSQFLAELLEGVDGMTAGGRRAMPEHGELLA